MSDLFMIDNQIKLYTSILGKTPNAEADALVKIGGESTTLFVPNINISKWADECFLNINHPDQVKIDDVQNFEDGMIRLDCGNNSHRYFIKEDGSLEYEIWFASQPDKPEVILNLLNTQGLDFFYQPELTEEQKKKSFRPDNVIGSYAVYFNKSNNQYQTGKLCHIYRPLLTDAKGNQLWAELFLDPSSGIMQIKMDEKWLSKAAYPVILDPNFGYQTAGASNNYELDQGDTVALQLNARSPAGSNTLNYISIYSRTLAVGSAKHGIYSESGGIPASRLAYDNTAVNVSTTEGWITNTNDLNYALSASMQYWAAAGCITGSRWYIYYDTGGSNSDRYGSVSILPDPWSGSATDLPNTKISAYCQYTAAGGGNSYSQSVSGVLSFSGAVTKQTSKTVSGGLTFSGSLAAIKTFMKSLSGALTFAGNLTKSTLKTAAGNLTFTGAIVKSPRKILSGGLSFTGSIVKLIPKSLSGSLSFSGSLSGIKTLLKTLTGGLTFSGSIQRQTGKYVSGSLTPAGAITKSISKGLSGSLSFVGNVFKLIPKGLSGSLSFSGSVIAGGVVLVRLIRAFFSSKKPTVSFAIKTPSIVFELKKPSAVFELTA